MFSYVMNMYAGVSMHCRCRAQQMTFSAAWLRFLFISPEEFKIYFNKDYLKYINYKKNIKYKELIAGWGCTVLTKITVILATQTKQLLTTNKEPFMHFITFYELKKLKTSHSKRLFKLGIN